MPAPGWHTPSGLGRTRAAQRLPAAVHTSAPTRIFRCTHQETAASTAGARPAPPAQLSRTQTRAHTGQGCTSSALLPGRAHTWKHLCKHTGMHAHTHLCETAPMCKSKPGHLCLPSAPPAPCPLHANPPGVELCHGNPQPTPQGPQSCVTGHAEPGVWGTAPPSTDSNTPLCPIPCQPWYP